MGQRPSKYSPSSSSLLATASAVLVRQLEARWLRELSRQQDVVQLQQGAEAVLDPVMLVDASDPCCWRVLHMNQMAMQLLGMQGIK
jgi:hypothetical protein